MSDARRGSGNLDDRRGSGNLGDSVDERRKPSPTAPDKGSSTAYRPAAQLRSDRLRLRRGLGFLGLTLVVPGSAQLRAGDRRVGRWAVRVWAALIALLVAFVVLLLVDRGAAIAIITFRPLTILISLVLGLAGIGWAVLMLDAWRIANPPSLARRHRLGFGLLSIVLALGLGGGMIASASAVNAEGDLIGSVFSGGGETEAKAGRYNVLLLGGDAGKGREGLRPDSMTVASIDATTGRTVLFSLPRNLEDVGFPDESPMKKLYPNGFTCPNHECLLNAVYTKAMENKDLYPGVKDPGAQATTEAIEWATGLDINYYALIDLNGFKALIDAVGGITIDVNKPVAVGGEETSVKRHIPAGKAQRLNGQDALWFARSRVETSDYDRMARQKCVMSAMLNQLDPVTVVTKFNAIASAGKQVVETNVPTSEMNRLMDLALKARQTKIASVSFVPPMIQPGAPDYDLMRQAVRDKIAQSQGQPTAGAPAPKATKLPVGNAPGGTSTPTRRATGKATSKATPTPTAGPTPVAIPGADDLVEVCAAA
ncbi:LCP family protein [Enemella evansiae]|uniref:LCP family protein n=1 Tax=Enemella evansiae TaxID=2016499 RepID=UPI000B962B45|nr:LCP family protein [Enemella evansiae]OYO06352.1 transcriptional regulator [Enemella evansiae]